MTRVLVTGASGFLASHIVLQLLERGDYMVRGTVRSLKNDKKVAPLRNLKLENGTYELELVEADLTNKESWTEAVKDCTFVIHVASPFPAERPRDEMEVIRPAVEGTKNVLEACAKTKGGVKRVVLTSSTAAICGGRYDEGIVFSEKEWASEEASSPYGKSKLQAEKTAWELVENLPDDEKFELCTINPGFILGPILQGTLCTSMELHQRFLQREVPMVPNLCYPACDVRDVAGAHITAMTSPTAPGNRFMTVTDSLWIPEMAKILDEEFRPLGYNVPTRVAPNFVLRILGLFSGSVKMILPSLGCEQKFDNSKVKHHLQYKATELRTSIIDMAYSMIDRGFIYKTLQYQEMKAQ
ncbi:dihydroflavonol 4-reductase-like isoform X1 [Acropora millepora]|uniref:dihydroflavonol 4-reductase-like isoform X1 n=1 Tax=Acropora millepora TaxID=45264 RepID=UPI0010FCB437|nr:dihydroflavonol 4-reductase-like isoform X1 [Acropora millepora]